MPTRKTSESQDRVLERIRLMIEDERAVERAARAEADELIRARTQQARNATNALMHAATTEHGITKSAIAVRAVGNTNRAAVDTRIREHLARHYIAPGVSTPAPTPDAAPTVAPEPTNGALTVDAREDCVIVNLDQFSHEDVGDDITGEVIFESDGTVRTYDMDMAPTIEANPLLPMRLWGLEEVQSVIRES